MNAIETQGNMYRDTVKLPFGQLFVGCDLHCGYCEDSFQKQMKRQKPQFDENGNQYRGCQKCYEYTPHFHEERYLKYLKEMPITQGDEFIWLARAGDISCAKRMWMEKMIHLAEIWKDRIFLFQTKRPATFFDYIFPNNPNNCLLGITLETDLDDLYQENHISNAPLPLQRYSDFYDYRRSNLDAKLMVTIEPILDFTLDVFVERIESLKPERVYVGYDTKNSGLPAPTIKKTMELIDALRKFTKVKIKFLPGGS